MSLLMEHGVDDCHRSRRTAQQAPHTPSQVTILQSSCPLRIYQRYSVSRLFPTTTNVSAVSADTRVKLTLYRGTRWLGQLGGSICFQSCSIRLQDKRCGALRRSEFRLPKTSFTATAHTRLSFGWEPTRQTRQRYMVQTSCCPNTLPTRKIC
jgi:hypothetical protein